MITSIQVSEFKLALEQMKDNIKEWKTDIKSDIKTVEGNLGDKIQDVKDDVNRLRGELKEEYVTKIEFTERVEPIRKIVYGVVSFILLAVLGALVATVVR